MNYFINFMQGAQESSTQVAAAGQKGGFMGGNMSMLMIFVIFALVLYFFSIRPAKKREKEQKARLASIKKGDRVQTIGGWRGTVVAIKESTFVLKIDDNARVEIIKNAVSEIVDKKESNSVAAAVKKEISAEKAEAAEKEAITVEAVTVSDAVEPAKAEANGETDKNE